MTSQIACYPVLIMLKQHKVLLLSSKDRVKYDGNIGMLDTTQTQKHGKVVEEQNKSASNGNVIKSTTNRNQFLKYPLDLLTLNC